MKVLDGLEPQNVFHYFEEISQIPRPTYQEKRISDYLVSFAKEHGLEYYQDELFNVIMIKEASTGYEAEEPIILQGHMDMVCEKEADREIDFSKDPLILRRDGDFITAEGTTLGGDDGIAVAYALAILSDDSIRHPRLEVVLTVSEEIGMEGAKGIDLSPLQGRKLLNLDSEEEGIMLSSCAGGSTVCIELPVEREQTDGILYQVEVSGLLGGHSGSEIDKERANANLLTARLFLALQGRMPYRIVSMKGGTKQNAIPRQTTAQILVPEKSDAVFHAVVGELQDAVRKEYAFSDPDIRIQTTALETSVPVKALTLSHTERVITLLSALPNGVQAMSSEVAGLVKTSLNLGILNLTEEKLRLEYSVRSSAGTERAYLEQKLSLLVKAFGGTAEISAEYPAWEYRADSRLREDIVTIFERMYGKKPKIEGIHAGLECGILAAKLPGMDAVSLGPDILDIHTTMERMSVSSVKRVYDFLIELLGYRRHE